MIRTSLIALAIVTATSLPGAAGAAEPAPNLAGTYRCVPLPSPCQDQNFTVTQSGDQIQFKGDKGFVGHAKLTSPISLSGSAPWNSLGVITENHIQWSNGTQWRKM